MQNSPVAPSLTSPDVIRKLYQMLRDIHGILCANGIQYWMDSGTLLGAVRHGGIIPWDDDADIALPNAMLEPFLRTREQFLQQGYQISEEWCGYKIFPSDGIEINPQDANWKWQANGKQQEHPEKLNYKFPFVDVFTRKAVGDKFIFLKEQANRTWPRNFFEMDELTPLKLVRFGSFELVSPSKPETYLTRTYGPDWATTARITYDHRTRRFQKEQVFTLSPQNLKPAMPFE